ncbi:MAG: DNA gyrase inhibitor YacG [Myxococcaceae bacterium]|nr:DNA gyrase inhibitor YacG [Myxococcaceae bacterium]
MSTPKRTPKCPICASPVALRPENPTFPFCSPRCRQVDLGKWLGEEYRVAVSAAPEDEQEDELASHDGQSEDDPFHRMH